MMDEDMDHHRRQQAERKRKLSALAKKQARSVQPQKTIELTPIHKNQQEPANKSTLLPSGGVVTQYIMTG